MEVRNSNKKGMVLPFQPLSLAFDHVNYYVDMPAVSLGYTKIRNLISIFCTKMKLKFCKFIRK